MEPPVDVAPEFIQPRPPRTGRVLIDVLVGGVAIMLSVISLIVAIQNERTQRELVAASSWPFLQVDFRTGSKQDASIELVNAGVGPAKVESFEMFYQGRPVDSPFALLQRCCGLSTDVPTMHRQLAGGISLSSSSDFVLRPADRQTLMRLAYETSPPPANPAAAADRSAAADAAAAVRLRFMAAITDVTFRACYCSVLDECWQSTLADLHPRRVGVCPSPAHPLLDGPTPQALKY